MSDKKPTQKGLEKTGKARGGARGRKRISFKIVILYPWAPNLLASVPQGKHHFTPLPLLIHCCVLSLHHLLHMLLCTLLPTLTRHMLLYSLLLVLPQVSLVLARPAASHLWHGCYRLPTLAYTNQKHSGRVFT